jgi:site-specific recombinase XerD
MRSTFKISFYVNAAKEKNGQVPIMGRITINGGIAQFSCKQSINLSLWDAKVNRATGKSDQAVKINRALDNIRAQLTKHYQHIVDRDACVSAERVKNAFLGIGVEYDTLLTSFDKFNGEFMKHVGTDRAIGSYYKYAIARKHLGNFIKSHYRRSDIMFREVDETFINDYAIYLHSVLGQAPSTVWKNCIPLKMLVNKAHNSGIISHNPFAYFHMKHEVKERGYLSEAELECLMKYSFPNRMLALIRDIFVFASFTGISYIDIRNLTLESIETFPDGSKWIVAKRQKTQTPFRVKLLAVPLQIMDKYSCYSHKGGRLFQTPTNWKCNLKLKEIAKACGIAKHLTFHMSRHTFATLALTKGVPIESVSKMLGHTKITTTQIYAKITQEKMERDMDMFSQKLDRLNGILPE